MSASRRKPERTCLGCRQVFPQDELVRYVLAPDGAVLVDYRNKLPGRGAYTCFDQQCLAAAVSRRQFSRTFKQKEVRADAVELGEAVANEIRQKILNLVGMARKSASIVTGSNMVLGAMGVEGAIGFVLLAEDVSAGIAEKVEGSANAKGIACWRLLDKESLGKIVGKEERSVVALKAGSLTDAIMAELIRYKKIAGES